VTRLVVLGVTGGIAAFRAVEVLRSLVKSGCQVVPILTRNAARFVSPRTFAVLSSHPAQVSLWRDGGGAAIDHVEVARVADLLLVAPATANVLAKLAAGVADDALTTYALAHRRAVVLAPAMNTFMWRHEATQRGAVIVEPDVGWLACREVGEGKLAAVEEIVAAALAALPPRGPLAGVRVLVTAGATREPVDAVRLITNRSSGRMGVAVAEAAQRLGATVTILAGGGVPVPATLRCERFGTAEELGRLLAQRSLESDWVWHAAAVADFRPAQRFEGKLDRRQGGLTLELEPVPDLARALPRAGGRPFLVIFAAERAADLEARALRKLEEKRADAVVANPIDEAGVGMEADENRAVMLAAGGWRREFPQAAKEDLAHDLLLALFPLLARRL
jgi:phosphopantothenoylcysteine decarboxylase/phosphopantothenate--cysteine ligase